MRTQAAVLYAAGTDWQVEDIELDPPRTGEVLVRVAAAGLCHSEEHHRAGDVPFAAPMVGGHEGAGFVEATGPGVTLVKPGDYIVFSSIPNCGRCPSCVQGRQNLCDVAAGIMAGVQLLDGSSPPSPSGQRPPASPGAGWRPAGARRCTRAGSGRATRSPSSESAGLARR